MRNLLAHALPATFVAPGSGRHFPREDRKTSRGSAGKRHALQASSAPRGDFGTGSGPGRRTAVQGRTCLGIAALLLAGCGAGPDTTSNPHTGVTVHRSGEAAVGRSPASAFYARAVAFEAGGQTRYALLTRVVRSDLNYPVIESAWSHGRRLAYEKGDRRRVGCGTATGCQREEVGSIAMSRALFEAADRAGGLTLQLVGRRGSYTGHMPGGAFAEVLDRAGPDPP